MADPQDRLNILREIEKLVLPPIPFADEDNKPLLFELAADIGRTLYYLPEAFAASESDPVMNRELRDAVDQLKKLQNINTNTQKLTDRILRKLITGKTQSEYGRADQIVDYYKTIRNVLHSCLSKRMADIFTQVKLGETEQCLSFEKELTAEESRSLFESLAFEQSDVQGSDIHPKLINIGKEIVEKCKEVRVVVEKVAKGLSHNRSQSDWEFVRDNFPYCLEVLLYDEYLPERLKLCFSYCCLFPEDHEIDVQDLITLWMAQESLIQPNEAEGDARGREYEAEGEYEEVGRDNFQELLHKGFLQSKSTDAAGDVTSCKMPSLIRQLATHVARKDSKSFALGAAGLYSDEVFNHIPQGVVHVSLIFDPDSDISSAWMMLHSLSSKAIAKKLTTLLIFFSSSSSTDEYVSIDQEEQLISLPANEKNSILRFENLAVLGLSNLGMKTLPYSISKLWELKYLDLSKNGFRRLPRGITKLRKLQTLKLSFCHRLRELPKDMGDLSDHLRHLMIDGCFGLTHMPSGMGKLTGLRTLSRFAVEHDPGSQIEHEDEEDEDARPEIIKLKYLSLFLLYKHLVVSLIQCTPGNINEIDEFRGSFGLDADKSTPCGIKELGHLKFLSGNLEILHLHELKDGEETKAAKLEEKKNLGGLILKWHGPSGEGHGEQDGSKHKASLEGLKPHSDLLTLFLSGYMGGDFPTWTSSSHLQKLVKLTLYNCPKCQCLPHLDGLSSLKILQLLRLQALEFVQSECHQASTFVSLEKLTIWHCPSLKGWTPSFSNKQVPITFGCALTLLKIQNCPLFTDMPLFPYLKNKLILINASLEPLRQTIQMMTSTSPSTSSQLPLSELKHLHLERISEQDPLPPRWLTMTSLQSLRLDCPQVLESFSEPLQHRLPSLEHLKIKHSQALSPFKTTSSWESLRILRSLTLWGISGLEFLPEGILKVETLENIRLFDCPELVGLPSAIEELTLLKRIVISKCDRLASLPNKMPRLLESLVIQDCPSLLAWYQREMGDGPNWLHKIKFSTKPTPQDLE